MELGTRTSGNDVRSRMVAGPITRAHDQQLDNLIHHGDAAASNLFPTSGNRFELLEGSEAFVDRLVADIESATSQINLTEYAIKRGKPGGTISERVLSALMRRADEGLPVTVIMDAVGSEMVFQ